MRFTIKKIEEIKKALSSVEDSLVNSYLKVGTKKYFVHKNSLYSDPNFTKIAGHFQNGMAMIQHKRKMTLSKRSKKSKNTLSNTSNGNKASNNLTMNKNKSNNSISNSNSNGNKNRSNNSNSNKNKSNNSNGNKVMNNSNSNKNRSINSNGNGNKGMNNSISNSNVAEESEEPSEGMPESVIETEESSNSSSFPDTESVESRD